MEQVQNSAGFFLGSLGPALKAGGRQRDGSCWLKEPAATGLEPRSWGTGQLSPAEQSSPGPAGRFRLQLLEICSWKPLARAKFLPPSERRRRF